jgi:aryl-alcohol dehydrogenase-like predicted oxidoreductase
MRERSMEYRQLGSSGLRVSTTALGTMTFGGRGGFARVGSTEVDEARLLEDQLEQTGRPSTRGA